MKRDLNAADLPRLARAALADERAVVRLYAGSRVKALTRARVMRAAQELGLPFPPNSADANEVLEAEGLLTRSELPVRP